jgi:protein SCO1/2
MPRAVLVLVAALLCGGVGWSVVRILQPPAARPVALLPDFGALPAFALRDEANRPFTRDELAGAIWVVDFIFTRCAGQCPLMNQRLQQLAQQLPLSTGVRLLSISVDPAHDTPAVLAAYARDLGANPAQWRFLTGAQADVWRLSREGFRLGISSEGTAAEPVTHSVRLVVVDAAGHIRGYYDALEAEALQRLIHDVRQLVAQGGV